VAFVRHLDNVFRFHPIVSEYEGLGIGPTDQLGRDLGSTVHAFRPSIEQKALAHDNLKSRVDRGTFITPMHPTLPAQLRLDRPLFRVSSHGLVPPSLS
jgi:hypothetical protein